MMWVPILSFAVIAAVLGIGDLVASKTKGIVSSVIVAILIFLVLGGCFHLLPPDLMDRSDFRHGAHPGKCRLYAGFK